MVETQLQRVRIAAASNWNGIKVAKLRFILAWLQRGTASKRHSIKETRLQRDMASKRHGFKEERVQMNGTTSSKWVQLDTASEEFPQESGIKAEQVVRIEIFWCLLINKMVLDLYMSVVNGATLFHAEAEKQHQKNGSKAERVVRVEIFWCPLINKMVLDLYMSVVNGATLFHAEAEKWHQSRTGCVG